MIKLDVFGNINKSGIVTVENDKWLIDILTDDCKGMSEDKHPELLQVGGPLGVFITGTHLETPISDYLEEMKQPSILFMNKDFCPVDYSRFLVNYVIKEMGVTSEKILLLEQYLEAITSGRTDVYTYTLFQKTIEDTFEGRVEEKLRQALHFLYTRYKNVFNAHYHDKKCEVGICHRLYEAQCVNACPAEINIPGYVALMAEGRDEEAYRMMRKDNPLSLICGKICARPCESKCRRGEIEHTVGVRALKHYAANTVIGQGHFTENQLIYNGKSVAIVGAGPAGLSAAYYLAKSGYQVVMYEKYPVVGGMLAVGVPAYRLSQQSIDQEVKLIKQLGVSIHTDTEIGKDILFSELLEGYDSILLATGCHMANGFSMELHNVEAAIDFLRGIKLDQKTSVGKHVVVIGGGDVAMDAARSARRLGAEEVTLVSLETYLQMPANEEEKEEAIAEGIVFINGYGTKEILQSEGKAYGINLKKCHSLYDLENQFSTVYDEKDTQSITCDHIILAIGQRSDIKYLESFVDVDQGNRVIYGNTYNTSLEGVYVAGDISGPGSAIKAIAEGKKAATFIDSYLDGNGLYIEGDIEVPNLQSHYSIWDTAGEIEETQLFHQGCEHAFDEYKSVLTKEQVQLEASRCMRCDRNSQQ